MQCYICPINKFKNTFTPSSGPLDSRYIIIGEGPGKNEVAIKKPFVGQAGNKLWNTLKKLDFTRPDFYITNIIKCMVKNPDDETINACKGATLREIQDLPQRKLIIIFGAKALAGMGISGGITQNSGNIFWSNDFQCAVLPCLHPASTLYDNKKSELFEKSLEILIHARIVIETFGDLKVLSHDPSEEIQKLKRQVAKLNSGKEILK